MLTLGLFYKLLDSVESNVQKHMSRWEFVAGSSPAQNTQLMTQHPLVGLEVEVPPICQTTKQMLY